MSQIAPICEDIGVKINDVPDFIENMEQTVIPFSKKTRVKFGQTFEYEKEQLQWNGKQKDRLKELPESLLRSLYQF